jgi:homeodomain-containing protein
MATHPVPVLPITLTRKERTTLRRWARGLEVPRYVVLRARIILRAAAGLTNAAIARALRTDRECVGRWRARFAEARLAGLEPKAWHPGRPPEIPATVLQALVTLLTTEDIPEGRFWSCRSLARLVGVSPATIHRICQATGLTPHWGRVARLRRRPPGFSRLTEVLGGYLSPLDSALVVGGDAVGPHQPKALPAPRRPGERPPSVPARYTVVLPPPVRVVAGSPKQNRVPGWLQFLNHVAAQVPPGLWVHLFADNLVTHQHPAVAAWFAEHPEVVLHLVPTGDAHPRWFLRALQLWAGDRVPPAPPLPPNLRRLPKKMLQLLQEQGGLRLPRDRRAAIRTLRAAVTALRPRARRQRDPDFWMLPRLEVPYACGNPRWYLPPDP